MPAWIPLAKVVFPYIAPIFAATLPAFAKKKSDGGDPVVSQQISELQEAVKANEESIAMLAKALDEAVKANDEAIRLSRLLAALGIATAFLAVGLAVAT